MDDNCLSIFAKSRGWGKWSCSGFLAQLLREGDTAPVMYSRLAPSQVAVVLLFMCLMSLHFAAYHFWFLPFKGEETTPGCQFCCCSDSGIKAVFRLPAASRFFFCLPRFRANLSSLSCLQYIMCTFSSDINITQVCKYFIVFLFFY